MGHWMIADRLIRELGARAPQGGLQPPAVPKGYQMPRMSRWTVEWAVRQTRGWVPDRYALVVEDEFRAEFDRFILKGHKDWFAINRDATDYLGNDWKLGRKPVTPAPLNWQLKGYLALGKLTWPTIEHARFRLGQPWNKEEDGFQRVTELELDRNGLDGLLVEINDGVNAALDDPMTVDSGPLQCAWCPVGIQCPAVQEEIEYVKAHLTPESLAAIKGSADDALLGDIVISARTVKGALERAEELLKERIAANGSVVAGRGTKITTKQVGGKSKVTNPTGAFAAVNELLPADRVPHVLSYSKTKLIDEIAAANKVNKGGEADITAKTLYDIVMAPNMEQGVNTHLVFNSTPSDHGTDE